MNMMVVSLHSSCGGGGAVAAAASPHVHPPKSTVISSSRRRCFLTSLLPLGGAVLFVGSANSLAQTIIPEYPPKSPLIEQLLEKSRANKAKNDRERVDGYYERNYKEYFEFLEGTIRNKTELTETEKGILEWLDKTRNKKK